MTTRMAAAEALLVLPSVDAEEAGEVTTTRAGRGVPAVTLLTPCDVARCTVQQTHHHLDEVPERPVLCDGRSNDYDRFLSTCCELGPLLKPNPAPHGLTETCTCTGCWACVGNVLGCTCDVDWDELHEAQRAGGDPL